MSTYLVTGGCGFIGSHLVDELIKQKHDVVVLDNLSTGNLKNLNKRAKLIIGDICDASLVSEIMSGCDGCFHLAAVASVQESLAHWVQTNQTNLVGTITLLNAARAVNESRPFPFVYASSAAVYGDSGNPPYKESDALSPISPYGADKESCELQAKVAGRLYQVPNVGLRFFNVYGERQNPNSAYSGVISIFLNQIKQGKSITIFGDGEQVRDFIYVKDIVSYLCASMQYATPESLVFNACNGHGISVNDLAFTLVKLTGVHTLITHVKASQGDVRVSIGDNALALSALQGIRQTPFEVGLKRLCDYYNLGVKTEEATFQLQQAS